VRDVTYANHVGGRLSCLITLICASTLGCGAASRVAHPDATLRSYVEAVESEDYETAYRLLSEEQRARMPVEEFRRLAALNGPELEDQARQLRRHLETPIAVTAELRSRTGETASFALEQGQWTLTEGAAGSNSLQSPRHTVRALRRALQRRSYDGVLDLLSRDAQAIVEDEVERIIEALAEDELFAIEVTGNRARVFYDDDHFIDLVREQGRWVITDLD